MKNKKKRKPQIMWAVVDKDGWIYPFSVRQTRRECRLHWLRDFSAATEWSDIQQTGRDAVKVKVQAV